MEGDPMKVKHLRLDNTAWMAWRRCPRKFFHEYVQGYKEDNQSKVLSFGQVMHEGLEAFHSGLELPEDRLKVDLEVLLNRTEPPSKPWNSPLDATKAAASELLLPSQDPTGTLLADRNNTMDRYSQEHALWLMYQYITFWGSPFKTFRPKMHQGAQLLEQFASVKINDKLTFCGTFDGLVENGQTALLEHKTAGSLYNFGDKARLSLQGVGYVALAQSMGIEVDRVIFNALCTAWGRSNRQLFSRPEKMFARHQVNVPKWRLEEWKSMLEADTRRIIEDIESGAFSMTAPEACLAYNHLCQFEGICSSDPKNRDWFLKSSFDVIPWKGFEVTYEGGNE